MESCKAAGCLITTKDIMCAKHWKMLPLSLREDILDLHCLQPLLSHNQKDQYKTAIARAVKFIYLKES